MIYWAFVYFGFAACACAAELSGKFLRALHLVETGGRYGAIYGDAGLALGPFQIHRDYWKEARLGGRYEDCADYQYSVRVVTAVLNRYAARAVALSDFQVLARIHHGGPKGHLRTATLAYWHKVERALGA